MRHVLWLGTQKKDAFLFPSEGMNGLRSIWMWYSAEATLINKGIWHFLVSFWLTIWLSCQIFMSLLLITVTVDYNMVPDKTFYLWPNKVFVAVRFNSRQRLYLVISRPNLMMKMSPSILFTNVHKNIWKIICVYWTDNTIHTILFLLTKPPKCYDLSTKGHATLSATHYVKSICPVMVSISFQPIIVYLYRQISKVLDYYSQMLRSHIKCLWCGVGFHGV